MLYLDDLDPVEVATAIFKDLKFEHECTDDETVHALVPGRWGHGSLMVWHDYNSQYVNFFAAFDNLKINKRKTNELLKVINQLNSGLQIGTVSYDEGAKRIQFKYAIPTDDSDYLDPGVIEQTVLTTLSIVTAVQFQCMMVASGACKHTDIYETARLHTTIGTA